MTRVALLALALLLVACEGAGAAKAPQPSFAIPYAIGDVRRGVARVDARAAGW